MASQNRWAYDDLQLRIDRDADGSYHTLVMAPDGRTARGDFNLPLTDDELDDFVERVGLVRRRGPAEDRLTAVKELGSNLFDALFAEQVGNVYLAAKAAASDGERRMRITLHLSGAPELMRLPWEFLYHRPRFIAQSSDTPIIRTLDVDSVRRPQKLKPPIRILGITSCPVGYQRLDADSERRNLETALEPLRRQGLVELSWLDRATLRDLERRISEPDEIHVVHYIGHGAYSEETESGILVLETPEGRAHDVTGEEMGAMLQDERTLRLVILNSCDGARTSHIDPFSGVATSLIEFDIPAVVGMQFEITDLAAVAFSESLYNGLVQGMPIDAAIGPARRAIMSVTTAEFGTPVLFLRDGDASLFDIDTETEDDRATVEPVAVEGRAMGTANVRHPVEEPATARVPDRPEDSANGIAPLPDHVEDGGTTEFAPHVKPDSAPVPDADAPRAGISDALWLSAIILAGLGGVIALTGTVNSVEWSGYGWLIALGLPGVIGAIAVGIGAGERKVLGILISLLIYPIVIVAALTYGSSTYDDTDFDPTYSILSAVEITLLGVARFVTKRRPDATTPGRS